MPEWRGGARQASKVSTLAIKVNPDTTGVVAAARVIARHLNAMADELEALPQEVMPSDR